MDEYKAAHPAFDEGVYAAVDLDACVERRNLPVDEELAALETFLKEQYMEPGTELPSRVFLCRCHLSAS